MSVRAVSFVRRYVLPFDGHMFAYALALGDVDNDGDHECIVGSTEGQLCIYKGEALWAQADSLGTITCVAIGDADNSGKNSIIVVSAEGSCYLFKVDTSKSPARGVEEVLALKPCAVQKLPVNGKCLLIADIDGDGKQEFVVGKTDRVVLAYRWAVEDGKGRFVETRKWELPGQVGSLSMVTTEKGLVMGIANPGGQLWTIDAKGELQKEAIATPSTQEVDASQQAGHSTDMVGGMQVAVAARSASDAAAAPGAPSAPGAGSGAKSTAAAFATCTLGGSLTLYTAKERLWEMQVPHQLFSISKLDITGDGSDEVVACSWDGTTIIVDSRQNMVRYNFEEDVCGFVAGAYAREPGTNLPCLVYVTLSGRVVIYHDILLNSVAATTLSQVITPVYEAHPATLRSAFGAAMPSIVTPTEKMAIQRQLLYESSLQEWARRKKRLEAQITALRLQQQAVEEED